MFKLQKRLQKIDLKLITNTRLNLTCPGNGSNFEHKCFVLSNP